jgi:hypothetical protein
MELYLIALVLVVWGFHSLIQWNSKRIDDCKDYFEKYKRPVFLKSVVMSPNTAYVTVVNVCEKDIESVGFEFLNDKSDVCLYSFTHSFKRGGFGPYYIKQVTVDLEDGITAQTDQISVSFIRFSDGTIFNTKN